MRARVLHLPQPAKFGGDWTVIDQDGKAVVICKGVGNTRGMQHVASDLTRTHAAADLYLVDTLRDPASADKRPHLPTPKHKDLRNRMGSRLSWTRRVLGDRGEKLCVLDGPT